MTMAGGDALVIDETVDQSENEQVEEHESNEETSKKGPKEAPGRKKVNVFKAKRNFAGPFTVDEDRQIIAYIWGLLKKKTEVHVKGRQLWTDLVASKRIDRTWYSSKERYLKRIIPKLDMYKLKTRRVQHLLDISDLPEKQKATILEKAKKTNALVDPSELI